MIFIRFVGLWYDSVINSAFQLKRNGKCKPYKYAISGIVIYCSQGISIVIAKLEHNVKLILKLIVLKLISGIDILSVSYLNALRGYNPTIIQNWFK